MKAYYTLVCALYLTTITACAPTETKSDQDDTEPTEMTVTDEVGAQEAQENIDVDALVAEIDAIRASIEVSLSEPIEIKTSDLRAKLKQKWETIHIYRSGDEVVRIKTYPYADISKRTEEFYFSNGILILAVIEDDGKGKRGKKIEEMSKAYYFHQGEVIKEVNNEGEAEYTINDSDAEELLEEATEYLGMGS